VTRRLAALALALSLAACAAGPTGPKLTVIDRTATGCVIGGGLGAGVGYGLVAAALLPIAPAIPVAIMAGALIGGPFGCGLGLATAR
jgi:hypothetical protein